MDRGVRRDAQLLLIVMRLAAELSRAGRRVAISGDHPERPHPPARGIGFALRGREP